jgi:hypothetical protein
LVPVANGGFAVPDRRDDRLMAKRLTVVPIFVTSFPDVSPLAAGSHLPFLDLRAVLIEDERRLASSGLPEG